MARWISVENAPQSPQSLGCADGAPHTESSYNARHREVLQTVRRALALSHVRVGSDLFVHHTSIVGTGYRSLEDGQKVEFDVGQGRKGDEAQNVRVV